jgi:hypothetical protein
MFVRADVLVGSAVLHGAAVALFVHWLPPREAPPVPAPAPTIDIEVAAPVPPPPPMPMPIDVALLEPVVAAPAPRGAVSRPAGHVRIASESNGSPAGAGGGEPVPAAHPGGGLLHMRGPDLVLAPDTAEHIAAGGEPLHERAHVTGKLEDVSGGTAVIHDRVTTVAIERDGTAHFADKPDVEVHFHSPIPHINFKADMHDLGDALQAWYADPYAGTRYGRTADLSELNKAVQGACDTWGDLACDDPLAPEVEQRARKRWNSGGAGFHGPADLTAYLYRKLAHSDPYASRKLRLLDDTRAERVERGEAFRAQQAARSAELMQRVLEQLWASKLDIAQRKQALYELWADCSDDEAGQRARSMVLGWIRAKLPAGSGDAYTTDELARLAPFQPYEQ